ncbi:PucR family transcriptional regulator [Salisediminibacterium selenitireducens]|uniref:Transcriptional regulator, PucR family n=1 Tax=Bacillus selenitireducens (strain ATCC 700615 / DSM 15326 / MLS10) TaxID=439292 RepID=D6XX26_BACIE|nr:helix-turn-helix domain-containing protein [Salisediminibacterium selenitireducens]ADI00003.1 putative transcriptional regulator, PucR family [[Bacillus] selenitireducens MLS10]
MIKRLKTHFPHATANDDTPIGYQLQLLMEDGQSITLDKRELSADEADMLKKLFDFKEPSSLPDREPERSFHSWLIEGNSESAPQAVDRMTFPFRFIFIRFRAQPDQADTDFDEALNSFFPGTLVKLWRSPQDLVIVQEISEWFDDAIALESVVDTLASDFYLNIGIYSGVLVHKADDILPTFVREQYIYDEIKRLFSRKNVFVEQEAHLYYALLKLPYEVKELILEPLIAIDDDHELKETISVYLKHNMNTSSAAKELFMHRNTMQYRLDKFIEKTSIDMKQFPNAAACYLMLALDTMTISEKQGPV